MRSLLRQFANRLPGLGTRLLLKPFEEAHARMVEAQADPARAQERALQQLLAQNGETELGRRYRFATIENLSQYRARVPLMRPRELSPLLQRQAAGEADLLCGPLLGLAEDPILGSCPVDAAALAHWRWIEQLLRRTALSCWPELDAGRWLELLPVHRRDPDALPRGPVSVLLARTAYGEQMLPPDLFTIADDQLRFNLVLRLAIGEEISALRAQAPGTLALLADALEQQADLLLDELASGAISAREQLDDALRAQLPERLPPDPGRARELRRQRERHGRLEPATVWPRLRLLVCQTTGAAKAATERLYDRYPHGSVLDPGYQIGATPLSWPFADGEGGELILAGQLVELCAATDDRPTPLEELRGGIGYRPVVSAAHGLYRCALPVNVQVLTVDDGIPLIACSDPEPEPLQLGAGALTAAQLQRAVRQACRDRSTLLTDYSGWVVEGADDAPPAAPPAPETAAGRSTFWSRLRRTPRGETPPLGNARLTIALEADGGLDAQTTRALLEAVDGALRHASPAYDGERQRGGLRAPRALVIRRGAFARAKQMRIARGEAHAHASVPPLDAHPLAFDAHEIEHEVKL